MNLEVSEASPGAAASSSLALVATLARKLGYIDGDTVTRVVIGMNGLMIASFGNRLPKSVVPSDCARRARRVAGWSLVLSGLVYAGLWAFAPIPVAVDGRVSARSCRDCGDGSAIACGCGRSETAYARCCRIRSVQLVRRGFAVLPAR